jgi:hypothetical protein
MFFIATSIQKNPDDPSLLVKAVTPGLEEGILQSSD